MHHETTGKWPNEGKKNRRRRGGRRGGLGKVRRGVKKTVRKVKSDSSTIDQRAERYREFQLKRVGLFGSSSRFGQAAQAAGSIATPGNVSKVRSPVSSSVYGALVPGGRRPKGGLLGSLIGPGGGARNKYRCPPGFQFGGTFTDARFSTCGDQILAIPRIGPGAPSVTAERELDKLIKQGNLVNSVGNLSKNTNAEAIIRAAQIPAKPKKGSVHQRRSVDTLLGGLASGDPAKRFDTRVVRNDGVILSPVVSPKVLGQMDEFDDLADGSYLQRYDGNGLVGADVIPIFGTGLRDAYVYLPKERGAVRIRREGGELKPAEISLVQEGIQRERGDRSNVEALIRWANSTEERFSVVYGSVNARRFELSPEDNEKNKQVSVTDGSVTKLVPLWVFQMFLARNAKYREGGERYFVLEEHFNPNTFEGEGEKSMNDEMEYKSTPVYGGRFVQSRERAEGLARMLGCEGAHEVQEGVWSPCRSEEEFKMTIEKVRARRGRERPREKRLQRTPQEYVDEYLEGAEELEEKSYPVYGGRYTQSRETAEGLAAILGCKGVHKSGDMWSPCGSKEELDALFAKVRKEGGKKKLK